MQDINFEQAAECLKILAHPMRLKIVALLKAKPLAVGLIAKELDLRSHVASEHLRLMLRCGFLSCERQGQKIYYKICDRHLINLLKCMEQKFKE